MAQFYRIVIDYLEAYEPEQMKALRRERQLLPYVKELAETLHGESDRIAERIREGYPEMSDEQVRIEAENAAIAAILPVREPEASSQ